MYVDSANIELTKTPWNRGITIPIFSYFFRKLILHLLIGHHHDKFDSTD